MVKFVWIEEIFVLRYSKKPKLFIESFSITRCGPTYVLPMSYLCPTYVLPMSYLCPTYVLPMSYLCPTYVLPMSYLCPTYVLPMSYLCPTYVLPMSYLCLRDRSGSGGTPWWPNLELKCHDRSFGFDLPRDLSEHDLDLHFFQTFHNLEMTYRYM